VLQKNLLFYSCIIDQFNGKDVVFPPLEGRNETWQDSSLCNLLPYGKLATLFIQFLRFWGGKKASSCVVNRNLLEFCSKCLDSVCTE